LRALGHSILEFLGSAARCRFRAIGSLVASAELVAINDSIDFAAFLVHGVVDDFIGICKATDVDGFEVTTFTACFSLGIAGVVADSPENGVDIGSIIRIKDGVAASSCSPDVSSVATAIIRCFVSAWASFGFVSWAGELAALL
jgi:hypothetical protein